MQKFTMNGISEVQTQTGPDSQQQRRCVPRRPRQSARATPVSPLPPLRGRSSPRVPQVLGQERRTGEARPVLKLAPRPRLQGGGAPKNRHGNSSHASAQHCH